MLGGYFTINPDWAGYPSPLSRGILPVGAAQGGGSKPTQPIAVVPC